MKSELGSLEPDCENQMGIFMLEKEKRIDWCDLSEYLETFRGSRQLGCATGNDFKAWKLFSSADDATNPINGAKCFTLCVLLAHSAIYIYKIHIFLSYSPILTCLLQVCTPPTWAG